MKGGEMKNFIKLLLLIAIPVIALGGIGYAVEAESRYLPEGVETFLVADHTCVLADRGEDVELVCFCPCEGSCEPTYVTDVPEYNPEPTPEPTPDPDPTPKPACNRGIGNDSEGCDPGNSYEQGRGQGRDAGEDRNEHKKNN